VQHRRSVNVTIACAALILLGACGDAGSATPPPASAGANATASTAIASTPADDGCSADNSPTDVVATPGPAPDIAVEPQSEGSPLPDIVVRRINCAGGWVNLRNEIPADRPVLVWFWAPY
jgi:hypothetical protein